MRGQPQASPEGVRARPRPERQWSIYGFLAALVLACLLPGVIGAAILLSHKYADQRRQLENDTIQTARALMQAVDKELARAQVAAQALATATSLAHLDFAAFHRRARQLVAEAEPGIHISLSDRDGRQLVNTLLDFGASLPRHANPAQLGRALAAGQAVVSDIYEDAVAQRALVSVDLPVPLGERQAHVLSIGILPDRLNAILRTQRLPPDWIASVHDRSGTIAARTRSPDQFVGQKGSPGLVAKLRQAADEGVVETASREGVPVAYAYSRSPVTGWTVAIGIPRQSFEAPLMQVLSQLALGVGSLFAGGLALAWILGRKIGNAFRRLDASARALGMGETLPPPRFAIKEAGEVAQAIAEAAVMLKARSGLLQEANRALLAREETLELSAQRFQVAMEVGTTVAFMLDLDLRYTWAHSCQVGFQDAALIGKTEFDFFTRETADYLSALYRRVIATGVGIAQDVTVQSLAMPREQHFHLAVEPVLENGKVGGLICAASDITERKLAEQKLQASERRFRAIFEQAAVGMAQVSLAGNWLQVNDKLCDILGYAREELLGLTFQDITHPADLAADLDLAGKLFAGAIPSFSMEKRYIRKDGSPLWVNLTVALVRTQAGEPDYLVGVIEDIQSRRRAQEQLRKFRLAVEQSPISIVITDPAGRIEYVNPRFTQVSGYTLAEALGQNPRLLKSGATPPETYQELWETITRGGEWGGELQNRRKNGELFWESVRILPMLADDGQVINYLAVKEDVTQRKEQEQADRLRREQMLHNARLISMGEMAAALAHEMNQPLTAIANFSNAVQRRLENSDLDPDWLRRMFRNIAGQAMRAGDIVWRMREFMGRRSPQRSPIDIGSVIQDTVRLSEISLRRQTVTIVLDLPADLPPAYADRVQIEQVLFNLFKNGIEAMQDCGADRRLEIRARTAEDGGNIRIEVCDQGCGLPNGIVQGVFSTFCSTKPEGMGMGLSICRSIVEAHGGRLWTAPNGDVGTTFFFTLPVARETPDA